MCKNVEPETKDKMLSLKWTATVSITRSDSGFAMENSNLSARILELNPTITDCSCNDCSRCEQVEDIIKIDSRYFNDNFYFVANCKCHYNGRFSTTYSLDEKTLQCQQGQNILTVLIFSVIVCGGGLYI